MIDDQGKQTFRTPRYIGAEQNEAAQRYIPTEVYATRGSAVGFYVLLGIVALGLLVFALVSLSHSNAPSASAVVVQPNVPHSAVTPPVEITPSQSNPDPVTPDPSPAVPTPAPSLAPVAAAPLNDPSNPEPLSQPTDISAPPTSAADSSTAAPATPDGTPTVTNGTTPDTTASPKDDDREIPADPPPSDSGSTDTGNMPEPTVPSNGQARL